MCEQTIIAMSGRKGAGKNTVATFVQQWYADLQDSDVASLCYECSFADNIKNFCIDTLGLNYSQCYGNDDEKNTLTRYKWENAPEFLRWKFGSRLLKWGDYTKYFKDVNSAAEFYKYLQSSYISLDPAELRTGFMSAREAMQVFGTESVREVFGNVWARATVREIKKTQKRLGVITDNRFPNEIQEILDQPEGYIIRLTRSPYGVEDLHASESSLDNFNWNREKCFVLDNDRMTISEQNENVKPILQKIFRSKTQ